MSRSDFVQQIYQAAIAAGLTDAAARVMAAQGGIESSYGERAPGFNYFAITKGSDWNGPTIERADKNAKGEKIVQKFRVYSSPQEGIADRIKVMDSKFPGFNTAATVDEALGILQHGTLGKYYEAPQATYEKVVRTIVDRDLASIPPAAPRAVAPAPDHPVPPLNVPGSNPINYLKSKAAPNAVGGFDGLNPEFATRLSALMQAAENATGERVSIFEGQRDQKRQAQLAANYRNRDVVWDGVTYHPSGPDIGKYRAAMPGNGLHALGMASDIRAGSDPEKIGGAAYAWMHAHAAEFGLRNDVANDPAHFQMPEEEWKTAAAGGPVMAFSFPGRTDGLTGNSALDAINANLNAPSSPNPFQFRADDNRPAIDRLETIRQNARQAMLERAQFGVLDAGKTSSLRADGSVDTTNVKGYMVQGDYGKFGDAYATQEGGLGALADPRTASLIGGQSFDSIGDGPVSWFTGAPDVAPGGFGSTGVSHSSDIILGGPAVTLQQQAALSGVSKPGTPATGFNTVLPAGQEASFIKWKQAVAPGDSGLDYDFRGAFAAGVSPDPKTGHWPDTFKKPSEPTFSVESQYAKYAPMLAGHWNGDTYVPPAVDLESRDAISAARLAAAAAPVPRARPIASVVAPTPAPAPGRPPKGMAATATAAAASAASANALGALKLAAMVAAQPHPYPIAQPIAPVPMAGRPHLIDVHGDVIAPPAAAVPTPAPVAAPTPAVREIVKIGKHNYVVGDHVTGSNGTVYEVRKDGLFSIGSNKAKTPNLFDKIVSGVVADAVQKAKPQIAATTAAGEAKLGELGKSAGTAAKPLAEIGGTLLGTVGKQAQGFGAAFGSIFGGRPAAERLTSIVHQAYGGDQTIADPVPMPIRSGPIPAVKLAPVTYKSTSSTLLDRWEASMPKSAPAPVATQKIVPIKTSLSTVAPPHGEINIERGPVASGVSHIGGGTLSDRVSTPRPIATEPSSKPSVRWVTNPDYVKWAAEIQPALIADIHDRRESGQMVAQGTAPAPLTPAPPKMISVPTRAPVKAPPSPKTIVAPGPWPAIPQTAPARTVQVAQVAQRAITYSAPVAAGNFAEGSPNASFEKDHGMGSVTNSMASSSRWNTSY